MPRLEVAGGIASGKTTLARLFVQHTSSVLFENFLENPFWRQFYSNPSRYAFETELTFLLQHYNQLRDADCDNEHVLLDTSLVVDGAYADVNLIGDEHFAFFAVYSVVEKWLSSLDYLIWLKCGEEEQLKRIATRGRSEESTVTLDYLAQLNGAIRKRISELSDKTVIVEIDSEKLDFASDVRVQDGVVRDILRLCKFSSYES